MELSAADVATLLDDCLRLAVEAGVSEIDALTMATLNPAEYHGFTELGALGPGCQADILCETVSGFHPSRVFQSGRVVARDGAVLPGAVPRRGARPPRCRVLAELPLPIGGLMSGQPARVVVDGLHRLVGAAWSLGTSIRAPFMHLSFLGLSVLPELRLTDKGLVDVEAFELVPVAVD